MSPEQTLKFAVVTTIVVGAAIVFGTIAAAVMEARRSSVDMAPTQRCRPHS